VLGLAVAADSIGVIVDGNVLGIIGNIEVERSACGLVLANSVDPLGNPGIGVQTIESILVTGQRIKYDSMIEVLGSL
jgi:hypothetical protein